ncbi:hypothetical protein OQA88_6745 [Cercophora sp. LCS_1]
MAEIDDTTFQEDDHRVAYIFNPSDNPTVEKARPSKRRRISAKKDLTHPQPHAHAEEDAQQLGFMRLLTGQESEACVKLRGELFGKAWPVLEGRIQDVLREENRNTLEEVDWFLRRGEGERGKIPAGFIITGPNIASQDLLFEQLGERLCVDGRAKFVRLRSTEAPNLKGALKKIIREAAASGEDEGEDEVALGQDGRKYLDYDLEALHVALKRQESRRVVVAFQDSEAFDNGLLMDLIQLFHSWQDRIQFSMLFGIATSVELFQARLLKSTARHLYGGQFDVVQADSVLESVFKAAVAGSQAMLRLGPSLLRSLVERQKDQVAGIQVFISSLKYAYMCHFYANPLSFLLAEEGKLKGLLQAEHLEAIRSLDSFRTHVEACVEARQLIHAQSMLEDDTYLVDHILTQEEQRTKYLTQLLRSIHLITATDLLSTPFTDLYISALGEGINLESEDSTLVDNVRHLGPNELVGLIGRVLGAVRTGSTELGLEGWEADSEGLVTSLSQIQDEIEGLSERAKDARHTLKSKYTAQSKVLRTTVVAQKVQLSHDTATLTEVDKEFTKAIDKLVVLLSQTIQSEPVTDLLLHEAWVYDSKSPYRDVFIPRPGLTFGRALSRPHDYLSCTCCKKANDTTAATLPTTAILYHLYLEAGALINVADLWSAYYALVGDETEVGHDERTALVQFYRGLGELRAMGFVKQSKKKADHIAKLKWI